MVIPIKWEFVGNHRGRARSISRISSCTSSWIAFWCWISSPQILLESGPPLGFPPLPQPWLPHPFPVLEWVGETAHNLLSFWFYSSLNSWPN